MRILLVNLKLLYQCRRLWLTYFFYCLIIRTNLRLVQYGHGTFIVLMITALYAAWVVAAIQEQVAAKPFSFCLPGHRDDVRRLVLLIGSVISIVGGGYFAFIHGSSDVSSGPFVAMLCLGLCFTGTVYLIGMALTLRFGSGLTISGFLIVIIGSSHLDNLQRGFDYTLLGHPLLAILLGLSMVLVVWRWLFRPAWFRRRCAKPVIGPLGTADLAESPSLLEERQHWEAEIAADLGDEPRLSPAMDRRVLNMIRACEPRGLLKHFWGTAYTYLLPSFPLTPQLGKIIVLAPLLVLLIGVAGYMPAIAPAFIFVLLQLAANGLDTGSPLFSELLLCGGRRERFYLTTIFMGIFAALSALILMLPIFVLNLLAPVLPDVKVGGSVWTLHRIPLWLPMLSMIVFPILGSVSFWLHGRQIGQMISWAIGLAALMLLIFHPISAMPLTNIVLVAILSWLVFVLAIHRIAMRSDLGRR
jgi:hypothetical protein